MTSAWVRGLTARALQSWFFRRWHRITGVVIRQLSATQAQDLCSRIHPHSSTLTQDHILVSRSQPPLILSILRLFAWIVQHTQRNLWIEAQYYWSPSFHRTLLRRIRRELHPQKVQGKLHSPPLKIELLLNPPQCLGGITHWTEFSEMLAFQEIHRIAQSAKVQFSVYLPYTSSKTDPTHERAIYIHSKVIASDNPILSVGSANLAERALRLDTELQVTLIGRSPNGKNRIQAFRDELRKHWFENHPFRLQKLLPEQRILQILQTSPLISSIRWSRWFDGFFLTPQRITSGRTPPKLLLLPWIPWGEEGATLILGYLDWPISGFMGLALWILMHLILVLLFRIRPSSPCPQQWVKLYPLTENYGVRSWAWNLYFLLDPQWSTWTRVRGAVSLFTPLSWILIISGLIRFGVLWGFFELGDGLAQRP